MTTRADGPVKAYAVKAEIARPAARGAPQTGAKESGNIVKLLSLRDGRNEGLNGARAGEPDARPDPADDDIWRRLPKGIALSMLLAVPFWLALILWLVW